MKVREKLSSRLGFILLSAGCAIGMGNIWRFPYVTGVYGGGLFLLIYLFFLIILGWPALIAELAIGRAGRLGMTGSFRKLASTPQRGKIWSKLGSLFFSGNVFLLMFYTVVTSWPLCYTWKYAFGEFSGIKPEAVDGVFDGLLGHVPLLLIGTGVSIVLCVFVCSFKLTQGLESVMKYMMLCLFVLLLALVVQSQFLPNSKAGLDFFLKPNADSIKEKGLLNVIQTAMMQAFFTLSLGIGAIGVCGSYMGERKSLFKEGIIIIVLDTFVAICAGLIIFPACSSFGVKPDSGPSLVMITLPKIFQGVYSPLGGRIMGMIFFVFMSLAALSTLFTVFEALVSQCLDNYGWSRPRASIIIGGAILLLSLPCILGFNVWSGWHPLGEGSNILDLEDFIVSSNLIPLGALAQVVFCTWSIGWGIQNFKVEVDMAKPGKFSRIILLYVKYVLPLLIGVIWLFGFIDALQKWNIIKR